MYQEEENIGLNVICSKKAQMNVIELYSSKEETMGLNV
jgi:hypothetical protein